MNTQDINVSVIVAIFKSEPFLEKLIVSIMGQTHKNLEIILVDDGSPDKSGEICDKYAAQDSRIIVVHKPNGGACDARNKGLELATGEYVSIVDGDDWLSEDYVEYLLKLCMTTGSEMSMSENIFTTRDQVQVQKDWVDVLTPEEAFAKIIYCKTPVGPWNKLYKLDMIKRNNLKFSVPWSGEGLYFSSMAAQYSNQVSYGHRKVYNYRLNNAGSGLTNYNVQMGINAKWNIHNIEDKRIVRTQRTQNAVSWHIWKNNYFLLFLIVATNSKKKYSKEYKECLRNLILQLPKGVFRSEFSFIEKFKMTVKGFLPLPFILNAIRKQRHALANDIME